MKSRILTGIQPTNDLTIGNYLGSIKQLINLQNNEEHEIIIFVADLHAITTGYTDPHALSKNRKQIVKYYLAAGLDPKKVTIFYQSDVWAHTMLEHLFVCNTTLGELNRMTQFKDKSSKLQKQDNGTEMIPTGLLIYPALMAADILLYSPDLVPVGSDQKQHLELTRNIAQRFNTKYQADLFKIPDPYIPKVGARIMDLQNPSIKMSKSATNKKGVIFLNDPINESLNKIKTALTDNLNQVKFDLENQPGVTNLISLYAAIENKNIEEIEKQFQAIENYGVFKKAIMTSLEAFLRDFQTRLSNVSDDKVEEVIKNGAQKARLIADAKLNDVLNVMGFRKEIN